MIINLPNLGTETTILGLHNQMGILMKHRRIIIVAACIVFLLSVPACNVKSKYQTRSFLPDDKVAEIESEYFPTVEETPEEIVESDFLPGANGVAFTVNGIPVQASDVRELYDYYLTYKSDPPEVLKVQAATDWIAIAAVMSKWPDKIAPAVSRLNDLKSIAEAGAGFDYLIVENSMEPGSDENAGLLPKFMRGQMAPTFEMHAFQAEVGEIVGPFPTYYGWHLLKIEERDDSDPDNIRLTGRHLLLFHGLDPDNANEIRSNVTAWTTTAQVILVVEEMAEVLPKFAYTLYDPDQAPPDNETIPEVTE